MRLGKALNLYDEQAVYLGQVTPPPELRKAHAAYLESVRLASTDLDTIAAAFSSGDLATVNAAYAASSRTDRPSGQLRTRWRLDVEPEAAKLCVKVPAWVNGIGQTRVQS